MALMERGAATQATRAQRGPARWLEPAPDRDGPERDRPIRSSLYSGGSGL